MRRFCLTVISAMVVAALPAVVSAQADKIEAGKKVYATSKCATCHMIEGKGGKSSVALDGVGSKLTPAVIKQWIVDPDPLTAKLPTKPKVKMKKYAMADADLDALVAYMASLKKK
jgi:mono/diheme cytochrome c family protein